MVVHRVSIRRVRENEIMTTRDAAVAGTFYPAVPSVLQADIERMLTESSIASSDHCPKALIVPHAGYVYSGPVAASAYRLLASAAGSISRVVVLGPAHRVYVRGIAVPTVSHFATPFGDVPLDLSAIAQIETFPRVVTSDPAHQNEHSIEVQLPFLQSVLHAFSLVPLVVGECASTQVSQVIDALWGDDETLVVVSSDLSHYLPYREAKAVDADTDRAILARSYNLHGDQACGAYAINGLMRVADKRSLHVERLDIRNSGDTAGDKSQVVGYAAYALY